MNDIEKAFAYQNEGLEEKREQANKHLPKLAKIINTEAAGDFEFLGFVQQIVDDYMLNVCKLGRRNL